MNTKKTAFALLIPVLIWLFAPIIVQYPNWFYTKFYSECKLDTEAIPPEAPASAAERCAAFMTKNGQSGDLFGSTSSLFSGLALFSVAYVLWSDLSFRRRERKPIVTCRFAEDQALSFDKPVLDATPKLFYLKGDLTIASISETATHIEIEPVLKISGTEFKFKVIDIGIPMTEGKENSVPISYVLDASIVDLICANPTSLPPMKLSFITRCANLDGEKFESQLTYIISLKFADYLNRVMSMRHSGPTFDNSWDDRAAIQLKLHIEPGSWTFSEID